MTVPMAAGSSSSMRMLCMSAASSRVPRKGVGPAGSAAVMRTALPRVGSGSGDNAALSSSLHSAANVYWSKCCLHGSTVITQA